MAGPDTRVKLIDYCLRRLGNPVIDINIEGQTTNPDGNSNSTNDYASNENASQIQDRIDDALQYYQEYHFDAIKRVFLKYQITQTDIDNKYITVSGMSSDTITGIVKIFPISSSSSGTVNMFDLNYQLRLNELFDLMDVELLHYTMVNQHLSTIDHLINGTHPFDFDRHDNKLYIHMDWVTDVNVDEYICVECYAIIGPNAAVYNDRWLKQYATALLKKQWGENLIKYDGITLPGGVSYNASGILSSANEDLTSLESEMQMRYEEMPQFLVG